MMKRLFPILTLSAMALLGACSKDGVDSQIDGTQSVTLTASIPQRGATRGTPITDVSELTTMGAFCAYTGMADWTAADQMNKMFNQRLDNVSGTWTYPSGEEQYWNAASLADRYTFFAYAPYATTSNGITVNGNASTGGAPTLTYTVPSDVTKQPDLMVAVPRKNVRPVVNSVSMDMKHALTCVGFQVAGSGEQIKSIAITGVSVSETLSMDGGNIVWSATGAKTATDFTASINFDDDPDNAGQKLTYFTATEDMSGTGMRPNFLAANGYLMMIPQTLGTDAKIVLTMSDDTTTEIGLDGYSWTAGQLVNYHITLVSGEQPPILDVDAGVRAWDVAVGMDSKNNYPRGICPKGYRVPTQNELMMMWINYPGTPELNFDANYYWSATEYSGGTDRAWGVYFSSGATNGYSKTTDFRVRCVRDIE